MFLMKYAELIFTFIILIQIIKIPIILKSAASLNSFAVGTCIFISWKLKSRLLIILTKICYIKLLDTFICFCLYYLFQFRIVNTYLCQVKFWFSIKTQDFLCNYWNLYQTNCVLIKKKLISINLFPTKILNERDTNISSCFVSNYWYYDIWL